jgi:hypothetical protein
MPDLCGGVTVVIEVEDSTWVTPGQTLYIQNAGYVEVVTVPDETHIEICSYDLDDNAAPGAAIANDQQVSPAGVPGEAGVSPAPGGDCCELTAKKGDILVDSGVNDPDSDLNSFSLSGDDHRVLHEDSGEALGLRWGDIDLTGANTDITGALPVANGGTGAATAAGARTNLGAAASGLATASGLTTSATDKVLGRSSGGAGAVEEIACTVYGRDLLDDASVSAQRITLGRVLPHYGLLAYKKLVDCNIATSDNAVTMESGRYRIDKVTIENGSVNMTTATCGLFTAAGGGGTTLAPDQSMAALTATTKFDDLTLDAGVGTDVVTSGTLYIRIGTPQGVAATASFWIFGWAYD